MCIRDRANTIDKYCPNCKEKLKRYDTVKRIVRGKNHSKKLVAIERYKCPKCKTIHRDLSEYVYPFKHYEADIIDGVVDVYKRQTVSCLGACGLAPTCMVNEEVHAKMTPEKVVELINRLRGENG